MSQLLRALSVAEQYSADDAVRQLLSAFTQCRCVMLRWDSSRKVLEGVVDGLSVAVGCADPSLFRNFLARLSVLYGRDDVSMYGFCARVTYQESVLELVTANASRTGYWCAVRTGVET